MRARQIKWTEGNSLLVRQNTRAPPQHTHTELLVGDPNTVQTKL
jgi:hypothetical protein